MTGSALRRAGRAGYYALLVAVAAVVLFPLYYAVAGSLMTDAALVAFPPALFPTELAWRNYARVMQAFPLARQYVNSMVVSLAIVAGVVVTSVLSAYAFVFIDFPFRRTAFAAFMATMMIPVESSVTPSIRRSFPVAEAASGRASSAGINLSRKSSLRIVSGFSISMYSAG